MVAFQAVMEMMANNFPGAFAGYTLTVTESHQKTKVDTSGTAKAVVASFQKLGLDFDVVRPHSSSNMSGLDHRMNDKKDGRKRQHAILALS